VNNIFTAIPIDMLIFLLNLIWSLRCELVYF